jgi:hypothetical protein
MLDHGEVELSKIFTKCVDSGLRTQEIAMCLSTLCIGHHIGLVGVIMNFQFIIFDQFKPFYLPHVKFRLGENIFEALVIGIDIVRITKKVMPPNFYSMNNGNKFKIMSRIIFFMSLQLVRSISNDITLLHENTP